MVRARQAGVPRAGREEPLLEVRSARTLGEQEGVVVEEGIVVFEEGFIVEESCFVIEESVVIEESCFIEEEGPIIKESGLIETKRRRFEESIREGAGEARPRRADHHRP